MPIKFARVVCRERREQHNIERLEAMSCVRGKDSKEYLSSIAKRYEVAREVAAMAIKDEEPLLPSR